MIVLDKQLRTEAILLDEKLNLWADNEMRLSDKACRAEDLPADFVREFFEFVSKISLKLLDDKDNFYGYFFFQMGKEIRLNIGSATATNFKGAKYVMYFNPFIFLPLTIDQMGNCIRHEILHIVFQHLQRAKDLQDHYSKLALNLAMDIVVNTYLRPLPDDAATLDWVNLQYHLYLTPFGTLEDYVQEIQEAIDKREKTTTVTDEDNTANTDILTKFDPLRTHDVWNESDTIDAQLLGRFTEKYVDAASRGNLSDHIANAIAQIKDSNHTLPWHFYLKKLAGTVASGNKKTTARRNRRQPERLDLRGQLRNYKAKIYIALDISGSISDDEFKQAMEEVFQIVREYKTEITIIQCDDHIRKVYTVRTIKDLQARPAGRGGTYYAPVIEYANKHKIDLLLYFTDGKGEDKLRTVPSGYKILWLIGGNGDDLSLDNPYGIVKRLHPLEEENSAAEFFFVEKGGYSMNNQEGISLNF